MTHPSKIAYNAMQLTDGSTATINKWKPLIEINYKNRICWETTKKQYTKAEGETLDVMCGESPEKTYCKVYGESLSTSIDFCYKNSPIVGRKIRLEYGERKIAQVLVKISPSFQWV